ncbi:methyl-accepting chemotaxis protein [Roseateles cellulosilyticus]|uniref:Methyl-accepting chemotaxis protein n=1 Tax=Pelomonas cellulosilytica TaxID=2906762 RepID=A0ABS8XNH8_9BURK|nr:methyl-accepting chemotaxis protein [Pelomonas sp. P8]MCE4554312.1 methyl-accepting chemotaxis protein [Pelomonas sp. P8]
MSQSTWTLKKRLTLTFAAILALACVLFGTAVYNISRMREATSWNTHTYQVLDAGQTMLLNMVNIETGLRGFVASGEERFLDPLKAGEADFGRAIQKAKELTSDNAAQQDRLGKLMDHHRQFMSVANSLMTLRRDVTSGKAKLEDLQATFKEGRDKASMDAFRAGVAEFMGEESKLLEVRSQQLESTSDTTSKVLIFGGLLMAALTVALGMTVIRSVFRQLGGEPGKAAELVGAVARGDLSIHIDVAPGDTTSLIARLADMRKSLADVVSGVRSNSESVATASAQISQGNLDLSQRTEEQASALQQTAATMDELGATVRHTADNARQANQLTGGASSVAARGGDVVGQVVDTMKNINESSKKIADIIGVIDGIAFQTNILALNAAVEAARAGEQGRGFAVVAGEVRTLAQRSAEAAKEIKTLITNSVEQVEQGTTLVDQAGQTMQEIVDAIRRVSDIVGEISSACSEQSSGVTQVGQAISQMDQVTQQNAALVEESAAAAASLKQQAEHLLSSVAVFKVG